MKEPFFQFPPLMVFTIEVFLISMTVCHSPICQLFTTTKNNGSDDLFFKHCTYIYTQVIRMLHWYRALRNIIYNDFCLPFPVFSDTLTSFQSVFI